MHAEREVSTALAPAVGAGVEECWMDLDGARLRYLRAGSGPPLILVHGLLGYSFSWRYTMPALAPYATVYAPDMMGAGFSDRPAGLDHSMRGTARRLLRFIAGLGAGLVSYTHLDVYKRQLYRLLSSSPGAKCARGVEGDT